VFRLAHPHHRKTVSASDYHFRPIEFDDMVYDIKKKEAKSRQVVLRRMARATASADASFGDERRNQCRNPGPKTTALEAPPMAIGGWIGSFLDLGLRAPSFIGIFPNSSRHVPISALLQPVPRPGQEREENGAGDISELRFFPALFTVGE
jgi:hypothetical protein